MRPCACGKPKRRSQARLVGIGLDVPEGVEKAVPAVRTTDVDLEGGKRSPLVLVLEEGGEDIEDSEAAVDDVFEDLGARSLAVRRVSP